jgi:hypothetical protein
MTETLTVTIESKSRLNPNHHRALTKIVQEYATRVFKSASDAEWLHRAKDVQEQEFNTKYFVDAERIVLDAGWIRRRTPRWHIAVEVLQPILWGCAGWFVSQVPSGWGWAIATAVTATIAAVSLAIEKMHKWMLENR